jgi:hypothetical protein
MRSSAAGRGTPAASIAASTPSAWFGAVVGTFARRTVPSASCSRQVGEGAADIDACNPSHHRHTVR